MHRMPWKLSAWRGGAWISQQELLSAYLLAPIPAAGQIAVPNDTTIARNSTCRMVDYQGNIREIEVNKMPTTGARLVAGVPYSSDAAGDPLAPAPRWRFEPAATNLLARSTLVPADSNPWLSPATTGAVVTSGVAPGPDPTTTADRLAANTASSSHYVATVALGLVGDYTFFPAIKAETATHVHLLIGATNIWGQFRLSDGVMVFGNATQSGFIPLGTSGYVIPWIRGAFGATSPIRIYPMNQAINAAGPSWLGTGESLLVWGVNVQSNLVPTAPILTAGAPASRFTTQVSRPRPDFLDTAGRILLIADGIRLPLGQAAIGATVQPVISVGTQDLLGVNSSGFKGSDGTQDVEIDPTILADETLSAAVDIDVAGTQWRIGYSRTAHDWTWSPYEDWNGLALGDLVAWRTASIPMDCRSLRAVGDRDGTWVEANY